MFTARAAIRRTVSADSVDSAAINALAGRVRGIASVGLKAMTGTVTGLHLCCSTVVLGGDRVPCLRG